MILLAVETCSGQGSLALARDDGWCEPVGLPAEWKSETLHIALARLLEQHGLRSAALDGYAVASGPGPFTGLRIGLTAVKALAEVHQKPIVTISTLEVVAVAARRDLPDSFAGTLVPLLDARRGQVFGAMYRVEKNLLRRLTVDSVGSLRAFLDHVHSSGSSGVRFCAPQIELFAAEIVRAGWTESSLLAVPSQLAATLARMGLERLKNGEGVSAAAAEANYVRSSDAEIFWKG